MSTSSGQNHARRRTGGDCAKFIFLLLICVAWNTVNAQSTHTSTKATTNSEHPASAETGYDLTRSTFNQATKYIYEKVEQLQDIWMSESKSQGNVRQESPDAYASRENTKTPHEAQFVCKPSQDDRQMPNPSTQSFAQPDDQAEHDSASVDEALQHIRGMIHILGRTHNALLEKKLAKLPLLQKLWVRYLHFYKDPYFAQNGGRQSANFRKALFDLARSRGRLNMRFGKGGSIMDTIVGALAKEMSQSVSAFKQSFHKAANGGWLMSPGVRSYIEKVVQSFTALGAKWLHKIGRLTEAARPILGRMPSHGQMQYVLKGLEDTVTEFKEELWRSRTEWMYQRGEALSWAMEKTDHFKRQVAYASDRTSENLNIYVQNAKQALRGRMECNKKAIGTLLVRVSEQRERLIIAFQRWLHAVKFNAVIRFLRNYGRRLVLSVSNSWRILAFIAVILLFRFLLGFLLVDDYVKSVIGRTISRPDANNSTNRGSKPTANRRLENLSAGSPNKSETSDSTPKQRTISSARKSPPNTSKPSRVRGPTSPEQNKPVKPRVLRRERRTAAKAGNDGPQNRTTPLQASNLRYQNTQTSLEKRMNERPIRLGNHEVQLVYEDVPRDNATDAQRNGLGATRTAAAASTTGLPRPSRRGEKQPEAKLRTENSDDVIVINSSDESTTSYGSANSRLTRASLRRASGRKSQAR